MAYLVSRMGTFFLCRTCAQKDIKQTKSKVSILVKRFQPFLLYRQTMKNLKKKTLSATRHSLLVLPRTATAYIPAINSCNNIIISSSSSIAKVQIKVTLSQNCTGTLKASRYKKKPERKWMLKQAYYRQNGQQPKQVSFKMIKTLLHSTTEDRWPLSCCRKCAETC